MGGFVGSATGGVYDFARSLRTFPSFAVRGLRHVVGLTKSHRPTCMAVWGDRAAGEGRVGPAPSFRLRRIGAAQFAQQMLCAATPLPKCPCPSLPPSILPTPAPPSKHPAAPCRNVIAASFRSFSLRLLSLLLRLLSSFRQLLTQSLPPSKGRMFGGRDQAGGVATFLLSSRDTRGGCQLRVRREGPQPPLDTPEPACYKANHQAGRRSSGVEQLIRNQQAAGSNPIAGSSQTNESYGFSAYVPAWLNRSLMSSP